MRTLDTTREALAAAESRLYEAQRSGDPLMVFAARNKLARASSAHHLAIAAADYAADPEAFEANVEADRQAAYADCEL